MKKISLDSVVFTSEVWDAWMKLVKQAADEFLRLRNSGVVVPSIPDEEIQDDEDGGLTLFVEIRGVMKVSLRIEADQWSYQQ